MSRQSDGLQRAPLSVNELISLGALGNQSINLSDKVAFVVSNATTEVQRTKSQLRRTQGELNVALQQLDSTKKILSKVRIARDKEKTQVHRTHEDRKVELETLRVELVVTKEELKRAKEDLYSESQISRSALGNAKDNKDKLVKEMHQHDKIKRQLRSDNDRLFRVYSCSRN